MPLYLPVLILINQSINLTQSIFKHIHTRASFFLAKFHVNQFHFSERCKYRMNKVTVGLLEVIVAVFKAGPHYFEQFCPK